ncbi:MAG: hypothetical protein ACRDGL_02905 [Candidatus Limnocylindrales bacterium]
MEAYLHALVAGDCATAHALGVASFTPTNGDLCGEAHVTAFTPLTPPATPAAV